MFQWKALGQCSKGDSCSFSHDTTASGNSDRPKGQSSSPAPNSKAKTDGEEGNRDESSDKRSQILCRYKIVKTRRVHLGIFPCVITTSLNPDAHMAINADFDMVRQRKSPAKSQRKVVRKDQLHY